MFLLWFFCVNEALYSILDKDENFITKNLLQLIKRIFSEQEHTPSCESNGCESIP